MEAPQILEFSIKAVYLVLWLSLAPILVATIVGLLVSLVQALTQIQEQTLSFGLKMIAVVIALLVTARWMGAELYAYCVNIFDIFPSLPS